MSDLLKMVIFRSCVELPEGYKNGDFIADYIIQYPPQTKYKTGQTWCTKTKCLSPAGGFNPSQEKAHCSVSSWVKNGNILEHINNWKPPISINQLCCGFCWSIHPYLSVKSSPCQATVWGPARLFSYRMIWRESWAITIHKKSWSLNSL